MSSVQYFENKTVLSWEMAGIKFAEIATVPNAKIVDIGYGTNPHPGATVLVDKFLDDNIHRAGKAKIDRRVVVTSFDGRQYTIPVVCADIDHMPFPDKCFDYAITSNVIEHVDDPVKTCKEISRIAKAGFVDVPRLESEMLFPQHDVHKWVFGSDGESLIGHEVKFTSPFGRTLHEYFQQNERFQVGWVMAHHYLHLVHMWWGELKCQIDIPFTNQALGLPEGKIKDTNGRNERDNETQYERTE